MSSLSFFSVGEIICGDVSSRRLESSAAVPPSASPTDVPHYFQHHSDDDSFEEANQPLNPSPEISHNIRDAWEVPYAGNSGASPAASEDFAEGD